MTKPSDSDQIEKAREQRVKDFAVKHDLMKDGYLALYELDLKFGTIYGFTAAFAASERQAVIEECAKMADQIAKSCSACSYSREKHGEEPSFCENFGCSNFADLAAAIRSMERDG